MNTQKICLDTKNNSSSIEGLFPFENKFVEIEKIEVNITRKTCPLCGFIKDLEYTKINNGFIQKICTQCAIKYVKSLKNMSHVKECLEKKNKSS